jgi:hypothetical protein
VSLENFRKIGGPSAPKTKGKQTFLFHKIHHDDRLDPISIHIILVAIAVRSWRVIGMVLLGGS